MGLRCLQVIWETLGINFFSWLYCAALQTVALELQMGSMLGESALSGKLMLVFAGNLKPRLTV